MKAKPILTLMTFMAVVILQPQTGGDDSLRTLQGK